MVLKILLLVRLCAKSYITQDATRAIGAMVGVPENVLIPAVRRRKTTRALSSAAGVVIAKLACNDEKFL